ncbi:MAG TPA: LysE family translocator [Chloroflexota bacterium]|nr:LysE family translocator [Chloroflexota bacterium]
MDLFDTRFATYILVSGLLIMAPGPDMALVTRNALSVGQRAAFFTAAGVALGVLGWALASALGVGLLLERSVIAFTVLKLAGAGYLIFLGLRSLLGGVPRDQAPPTRAPSETLDDRAALKMGAIGNLLNPKAGVIVVSILPQFVHPGDTPARLILMLIAFEAMLLVWLSVYGFVVSRAGHSRVGTHVRRRLQQVTGVVLIGLGIRLAIERG